MMATFEQAIELWKKEESRREENRLTEEAEEKSSLEKFVKEAFEEIGLIPDHIAGQGAAFQFQGEEIMFFVRKWKYGSVGVQRMLGKCPKCEYFLFSDEHELTLENIGYLLSRPQQGYHECWTPIEVIELSHVEKSTAEKLVELVNQLIDEHISLSFSRE